VTPVRVLVIGDGRMGRAVVQVAAERGCTVIGMLGPAEMPEGVVPGAADVAIEFTEPGAAAANVRACIAADLPVVSGTTGWDADLGAVREEARRAGATMLHAPNFSLGVAMFARLVQAAAALAAGGLPREAGLHLIETHHAAKKDAPSGTARLLARLAAEAAGREVPVTSVRVGSVPGTHEFVLDAAYEQIRLVHEARDRRVFADGAVAAALWLVKQHGVFTFDDFINAHVGPR
jgi:4-hydroxy-tetrahydrodipicolinate reductase